MTRIKNACNLVAEHISKVKIDEDLYSEMKFIRSKLIEYLSSEASQQHVLRSLESEKLNRDYRAKLKNNNNNNQGL